MKLYEGRLSGNVDAYGNPISGGWWWRRQSNVIQTATTTKTALNQIHS